MAYGLEGQEIAIQFPVRGRDFSIFHNVLTGPHAASYPFGTWVKQPGREADHSPLPSAGVKNTSIDTSTAA
jgi:hypothetical protein